MSKTSVLLLGATGETGGEILDGLVKDGSFEISILVQPSSAQKPAVLALANQGFKSVIADLSGSVEDLTAAIKGFDIVISAISATQQTAQLSLVDAAAKAGTKRFVPCGFTIVCPPGGIMKLRDEKEEVHQRIWKHHLPYTIIDVGYWHQLSWPRLSSGKLDYVAILPRNEIYGSGEVKTLLTDKRDIGQFVARIVKDPRTLNQKVFTWSDFISQNEITALLESKSGEKIECTKVSEEALLNMREEARAADASTPDFWTMVNRSASEYNVSKFLRADNTPENAKYLGYLDARELYPDFEPIKFEDYLDEILGGKGKKPYSALFG